MIFDAFRRAADQHAASHTELHDAGERLSKTGSGRPA
jgi:hypothetical protein